MAPFYGGADVGWVCASRAVTIFVELTRMFAPNVVRRLQMIIGSPTAEAMGHTRLP